MKFLKVRLENKRASRRPSVCDCCNHRSLRKNHSTSLITMSRKHTTQRAAVVSACSSEVVYRPGVSLCRRCVIVCGCERQTAGGKRQRS